jgi:hypothetical protein
MSTSPISRWAGVAAAILPSRRAAKLNMISGPGRPNCGMNPNAHATARRRHRNSTVSPAVVAPVITLATTKEHS